MPSTTPDMGLTLPTVSVTPGPDYANEIVADLSIIDGHNHSPGNGAPIANNTYLGLAAQASDPLAGQTGQGALWVDNNGILNLHEPAGGSVPVTSAPYASVQAFPTFTQVVPINTVTVVNFASINRNVGNHWSTGSSTFTAAVAADYIVQAQIYISNTGNDFTGATTLSVYKNSASVADTILSNLSIANGGGGSLGQFPISVSTTVYLNVGDTLNIRMNTSSGFQYTIGNSNHQSLLAIRQLP